MEFAKRINVSQGRLSEIESGTAMPSVETITLITREFSCDADWLLDVSKSYISSKLTRAVREKNGPISILNTAIRT